MHRLDQPPFPCSFTLTRKAKIVNPDLKADPHRLFPTPLGPWSIILALPPATLESAMTDSAPTPPIARKDRKETILHGITLADDYAWLRDKDNPEVTAYLQAENAYAESLTADLAPLRDKLYNEMLSHIKQTDESAPYREGDWWYYVRTEEGKQYSIFCRKSGTTMSPKDLSKSSSTAINSPKVSPSSPSAPPTSPTTAAGSPTPLTPPASANTPSASRISNR